MVDYKIEFDDKRLKRRLKRIGGDMVEINEVMLGRVGMAIVTQANQHYMSGPRPRKLGRISGDLAQSLYADANGSLWNHRPNELTIGTNLPYAARWEFGGKTNRGTALLPRPFLKPAIDDIFNSGKATRIAEAALQEEIDKRQ